MKKTPELVTRAKELRGQGLSYAKISKVIGFNIGPDAVRRWLDPMAAEKNRRRNRAIYAANPEGCIAATTKSKEKKRAEDPVAYWTRRAKALAKERAREKNLSFDLDEAYLVSIFPLDKICPVLGVPLCLTNKKSSFNSPTVDRLNPEFGYTQGNVAIISHRADTIKTNASATEVRAVADWMESQEL